MVAQPQAPLPPAESSTRVLVVSDDALARAGLAALLADQPGYTVVGQVGGSEYASVEPELYRPDVVLWDLGWEPERAVERLADAPDGGPPIVALVPDEAYAAQARLGGARGVLTRDVATAALLAALRAVSHGLTVLQPGMEAMPPASGGHGVAPPETELTAREREVLGLMAEGLPNKGIASRLKISEHTVKFHVNAILGKLGAQSRTEAVTRATRMGLILL